jgi:hypothetical protein
MSIFTVCDHGLVQDACRLCKCDQCGGSGLVDGHGHRPHPNDTGESHDCSSCPYPCGTCGGSGFTALDPEGDS